MTHEPNNESDRTDQLKYHELWDATTIDWMGTILNQYSLEEVLGLAYIVEHDMLVNTAERHPSSHAEIVNYTDIRSSLALILTNHLSEHESEQVLDQLDDAVVNNTDELVMFENGLLHVD